MGRDLIDGPVVLRWTAACARALEERRAEIDALNVFPVPDSDTGTNLAHTMSAAAARAAAARGATAAEVLAAAAAGAVDGARGNSGAILAQVLRGIADAAAAAPGGALDAAGYRAALAEAARLARAAVSMPMDGTVLSVLAAAAEGCRGGAPADAARSAAEAAFAALGRTTRQLDVLEAAGVVDAGGVGLLLVLDALVHALTGEDVRRPAFERSTAARLGRSGSAIATVELDGPPGGAADTPARGCPPDPDDYEVMYLLDTHDEAAVRRLRGALELAGNSVVVVGGGGAWSVHVHLRDAGFAVDRGLEAGRIREVRITHLGVQQSRRTGLRPGRAVLAVVDGPAAGELFAQEGAAVLGVDGEASGAALLDAVAATGAGEVLVLPNGAVRSEDLVVVSAAARQQGQQVLPLPSASLVQGLASIAVHDPARPSSDDSYAMAEAAAATRCAHLRIAEERALTWSGTCAPGDALGVIGGEVMVVEPRAATAAATLLDLMLGTGGELVTLLVGAAAEDALVESVRRHVELGHPAVELMVYPGGQHCDILQIGVE